MAREGPGAAVGRWLLSVHTEMQDGGGPGALSLSPTLRPHSSLGAWLAEPLIPLLQDPKPLNKGDNCVTELLLNLPSWVQEGGRVLK